MLEWVTGVREGFLTGLSDACNRMQDILHQARDHSSLWPFSPACSPPSLPDEALLRDHLHGTSSGEDSLLLNQATGAYSSSNLGLVAPDAVDPMLVAAASAAVTAETDLASKVLGSTDPIDFGGGN